MIISCSNSKALGKKIADLLNIEHHNLDHKYFPDGELYIRFPADIKNKHIVLIQTFQPKPQEAFVELLLAIETARELGAKKITLILPYFGYLRQDARFNPGEAVSGAIIGKLMGKADHILTIDPHNHRLADLTAVCGCDVRVLSARDSVADYLKNKADIIIGPDAGSYDFAAAIAKRAQLPVSVLQKKRLSAEEVKITFGDVHLKGKRVAIVDDIISTGGTMAETAKEALKAGASSVMCVAVHGIFAGMARDKLKSANAVAATNTIENEFSQIDVSGLIADELRKVF